MKHQRSLTPELGEQVLKTLGRYAKLPPSGIVAGQAVASALDEILGTAKPVYNDIDIFLDETRWEARWPGSRKRREDRTRDADGRFVGDIQGCLTERVVFSDSAAVLGSEYSQCAWVTHRHLYSIQESMSEGLLNHICVNWQRTPSRVLEGVDADTRAFQESEWLTKVFDLNCTQAAVDLETGRLYVTNHFENYFRSRQLQVVNGFTPVHSLLRYLKKRQELEAYGDDAAHIAMALHLVQQHQGDAATTQVRQRAFREGRVLIGQYEVNEQRKRNRVDAGRDVFEYWARAGQGEGIPLSFGRKYLDLYVKHQKVLNEHFMLARHARKDLWLFTSKRDVRGSKAFEQVLSPTTVALRFTESRMAMSKLAAAQAEGFKQLYSALESPVQQEALALADANMGAESRKGLEDANLRKRWLEVVPHHSEFFWPILGLTFKEQLELIRRLRTEFKKIGMRDPWGTIQGYSTQDVRSLLDNEYVWADFMTQHTGTKDPLCTPLPLPTTAGAVQARELYTSRDLIFEGNAQRHCVGGYSSSVKTGRCRIISFSSGESSDQRSTAEWRITPLYETREDSSQQELVSIEFKCAQHRSFANRVISSEHDEAEHSLRQKMNQWISGNLLGAAKVLGVAETVSAQPGQKPRTLMFEDLEEDIPF